MTWLPICKSCQFYAHSSYLVCTLHPVGVAHEADTCADFSPTPPIQATESTLFRISDLNLAATTLVDLGYGEPETNQPLVKAVAELIYDPLEELLDQPLSDFFYYVLRLSQLLSANHPPESPSRQDQQNSLDKHSILIRGAKFLLRHGTREVLSPTKRQFLFGDDHYIAQIISCYLSGRNDWMGSFTQTNFDDLLQRISANANLHGFDAVGRLYGSSLLFGYKYPPNFNLTHWEESDNREKYPPVPFCVKRTITFVKQRFDIGLDYPFG